MRQVRGENNPSDGKVLYHSGHIAMLSQKGNFVRKMRRYFIGRYKMKCEKCGGKIVMVTEKYHFSGQFIPQITRQECEKCGTILVESDEAQKIIDNAKIVKW